MSSVSNDIYDLNQLRTEPCISNRDERRVIKMSWSVMSKAAERSSRQRHDTFCDLIALFEVVVDVQESCFSRMMFAVG